MKSMERGSNSIIKSAKAEMFTLRDKPAPELFARFGLGDKEREGYSYAQIPGSLLLCRKCRGRLVFELPLAKKAADAERAYSEVGRYCVENELEIVWHTKNENEAAAVSERYVKSVVERTEDGFEVTAKCELENLAAVPGVVTERLTLSAITESDEEDYRALVEDRKRNHFWGYDDVEGAGGLSYFEVQRRDFEARRAVNFAVRLDGRMIGEAILYQFDCEGGASAGVRIAAGCSGSGYGREAFAALVGFGFDRLGLKRISAKCFRENAPSLGMLSSVMERISSDDDFFYFEKRSAKV